METDPTAPENSDQALVLVMSTTTDDQQHGPTSRGQGQGQGMSYECTFCKRGFSNAQALGGHMNIHRKEKAMLKQYSTNQHLTVNTPQIPTKEEDKKIANPKFRNWDFSDTHFGGTFSDETASSNEEQEARASDHHHHGGNIGKGLLSSSHDQEMDLELRLGHEPQDSSTGMTKFL